MSFGHMDCVSDASYDMSTRIDWLEILVIHFAGRITRSCIFRFWNLVPDFTSDKRAGEAAFLFLLFCEDRWMEESSFLVLVCCKGGLVGKSCTRNHVACNPNDTSRRRWIQVLINIPFLTWTPLLRRKKNGPKAQRFIED